MGYTSNMKKITIASILFIISILSFLLLSKRNTVPTTTPANNQLMFLINEVNNFDNLQVSDLPNPTDYRGVFKYGDNYIITGYGKIVEYNPEQNLVLRQSNDSIGFVIKGVVIGDNLYVVTEKPKTTSRNVYQIDLKTGAVLKRIMPDNEYVNVDAATYNDTLWISYWGGGVKYQPKTGLSTYYDNQQLGFEGNGCPISVTNNNGSLKMLCNQKVAIYNETNDSWSNKIESNVDYHLWDYDLTKMGVNFKLPKYQSLVKADGYYLIIADSGIYKLIKGGFPTLYKQISSLVLPDSIERIELSPDNKKIFFIGVNHGMAASSINYDYVAGVVDLERGDFQSIFKDKNLVEKFDKIGADIVTQKIIDSQIRFGDQIIRFDEPNTDTMFAEYQFAGNKFIWY